MVGFVDRPTAIGANVICASEKQDIATPTMIGEDPNAVRYNGKLDREIPSPSICGKRKERRRRRRSTKDELD